MKCPLQFLTCSLVFSLACDPKKKEGPASGAGELSVLKSEPILKISEVPSLDQQALTIRPELMDAFCIYVYRLGIKEDFSQELGVLCQDQKPTDFFLQIDRFAKIVQNDPKALQVSVNHSADGFSSGVYATNYTIPIEPRWVKSARIPYFMSTAADLGYLKLSGEVASDSSESLGGDLQFGKYEIFYETTAQTPDGGTFANKRKTEINLYQVQGGNSDIGVAVEHMIDAPLGDFRYYKTVSVTIGDKKGGSQVVTLVSIGVRNNGYPDLAAQIMSDTASVQAHRVHDGLLRELPTRIKEESRY